jgi:hypothetical protein
LSHHPIDTTFFKCFRSSTDGSTYYGEVAYFDKEAVDGAKILLDQGEYDALTTAAEAKE